LEQADRALSFFNYDWAIELYNQVLTYWPDNPQALSLLGGVYLALDERTEAEAYFEKAMNSAPPDLSVYDYIIHTWLIRKEPDTAWRVLERLEKNVTDLHYEFYIMQASYCVDAGEEVWRPWLERALEKAPPGEPALVTIGEMAMDRQAVDLGREYLERALEADQYPGQVHLLLGILAMQDDDAAEAEVRWSEAWRIARQTDDEALMERIEQARVYFSTPRGFWDMIEPLGLEGFEGLEDLFDDDLDEVW
jgi:tetratricopeptide (TPR) repeat protein